MRTTALAALALAVLATPALAGAPWVSVEVRAHRSSPTGSWLVLRTFHHSDAVGYPLRGTAIGMVDGMRVERPLRFESIETDRQSGVFAVPQAWTDGTPWVLNIEMEAGGHLGAGVVVGVGANGDPMFVRFPRTRAGLTRAATSAEVDALLLALRDGREPPRLARAGDLAFFARTVALPALLFGSLVTYLGWMVVRAARAVRSRAAARVALA
jgi:hypothetical protein